MPAPGCLDAIPHAVNTSCCWAEELDCACVPAWVLLYHAVRVLAFGLARVCYPLLEVLSPGVPAFIDDAGQQSLGPGMSQGRILAAFGFCMASLLQAGRH
jgi:hypothetical protein